MPTDEDALVWMCLTRASGVDLAQVSEALARCGSLREVRELALNPRGYAGLPSPLARFLRGPAGSPTATERRWLAHPDHHVIGIDDARFPASLRELHDCPLALYVVGRVDALRAPQLAIVGSRNPTPQGRENAEGFAKYLTRHGLTITSGLAEGIDAAAHRGALAVQGMTVGVLGTGIDVVYPAIHRSLAAQIARHGALISEFPLGTPPLRGNFPRRNRLIACLAQGTLVVEAAARSGSLITARMAGELGREVFALPGSIHNPLARGCHALIRDGARLTETAHEVLIELNFSPKPYVAEATSDRPANAAATTAGLDNDHKILLDALGFDPVDLDSVVVRTGFKAQAVSSMMLILELEGHVQAAPGGRYSRVARSP